MAKSGIVDLDKVWRADLLNRKLDADFLIKFLENRINERGEAGFPKNYVLNINAGWGQGKTFFLKGMNEQLRASGRVSVYINAWEDDYADDPMIAVMAAINGAIESLIQRNAPAKKAWVNLKRNFGSVALEVGKGTAKHLARRVIGSGVEAIERALQGEDLGPSSGTVSTALEAAKEESAQQIDSLLDRYSGSLIERFSESKTSIAQFRITLETFVEVLNKPSKIGFPLYILIDELDRCRPDYAILLLERIKHIFSAENVVFIVATDTEQLRHAVSAVYGQNFDGSRYLQRFFDRSFAFPEPEHERFVAMLFEKFNVDEAKLSCPGGAPQKYVVEFSKACGLALRDIEKVFDIIRTFITICHTKYKLNYCIFYQLYYFLSGVTPSRLRCSRISTPPFFKTLCSKIPITSNTKSSEGMIPRLKKLGTRHSLPL